MASSTLLLLFFSILLLPVSVIIPGAAAEAASQLKFPAILVFGDSLLDTGNNNFINTIMKANHLPYGESFPGNVPTGRFSNGKLISDFLASALGIKQTVPPFLDPNLSNDDIPTGVCFASAGSGYDDLTNGVFGIIPISRQLDYFNSYVEKLKQIVGNEEASQIINGSLVLVTGGSNDFGINFYDIPIRSLLYTSGSYQDFLQEKIQNFVKALYDRGCRNMMIAGLPPLGCGPIQMTAKLNIGRTCLNKENLDAESYNRKLVKRLARMQASLPGSKLVYADIYTPLFDMANNPQKYGFLVTNRGCCGSGLVEVAELCSPVTPVCSNPSQFLFWDAVHPGESAYQYMSQYLEDNALPQFSHP